MLLKDKIGGILKIFALTALFALCFLVYMTYRADAQSDFGSGSSSGAYFFTRDLKFGDDGEDVRELQRVLNSNSATLVANEGPGSPGNETGYFGTLTKWAVISFQEQYRSEILTPNGLSAGTGFVGPATRAKLNAVAGLSGGASGSTVSGNQNSNQGSLSGSGAGGLPSSLLTNYMPGSIATPPPSSVSPSAFLQSLFPQKISLLNVSKYQVSPGTVIQISGSGFANGENFLHIGDGHAVLLVPSNTPSSVPGVTPMQATIPADIAFGRYEVWITKGQNGTGMDSSRNSSVPFFIVVSGAPHDAPTISNVTPSPADSTGQIVITGSGFTSTGNNIYSTLGNISNVPLSGDGSITVRVSDFPGAAQVVKIPGSQSFIADGWLYVQNENGVNNTPATFKVKF